MLTPQDVRAAQFEKNIRGYRTDLLAAGMI